MNGILSRLDLHIKARHDRRLANGSRALNMEINTTHSI